MPDIVCPVSLLALKILPIYASCYSDLCAQTSPHQRALSQISLESSSPLPSHCVLYFNSFSFESEKECCYHTGLIAVNWNWKLGWLATLFMAFSFHRNGNYFVHLLVYLKLHEAGILSTCSRNPSPRRVLNI